MRRTATLALLLLAAPALAQVKARPENMNQTNSLVWKLGGVTLGPNGAIQGALAGGGGTANVATTIPGLAWTGTTTRTLALSDAAALRAATAVPGLAGDNVFSGVQSQPESHTQGVLAAGSVYAAGGMETDGALSVGGDVQAAGEVGARALYVAENAVVDGGLTVTGPFMATVPTGNLAGAVPLANGGTGATDAAGARAALGVGTERTVTQAVSGTPASLTVSVGAHKAIAGRVIRAYVGGVRWRPDLVALNGARDAVTVSTDGTYQLGDGETVIIDYSAED